MRKLPKRVWRRPCDPSWIKPRLKLRFRPFALRIVCLLRALQLADEVFGELELGFLSLTVSGQAGGSIEDVPVRYNS